MHDPREPTCPTTRSAAAASTRKTVQDGDVLNSCDAYRSKDEEGAVFEETSRTPSGGPTPWSDFTREGTLLTWTPNGYLAFTGTDDAAAGPARLYVLTSAFGSMADLENHLKGALGDTFLDSTRRSCAMRASPTIERSGRRSTASPPYSHRSS